MRNFNLLMQSYRTGCRQLERLVGREKGGEEKKGVTNRMEKFERTKEKERERGGGGGGGGGGVEIKREKEVL